VHADEHLTTTSTNERDWWNDPLGVFKPDAKPAALRVHGFIVGAFFGILGLIAVAVFSSAEKRSHRVIGAAIGLAVWLSLWIAISAN
jgi:hypothetical protein